MTTSNNNSTTVVTVSSIQSSSSSLEKDLHGIEYSKHEYHFGTKKIEYLLVRTKRRKTSEIIVDSDEILLRVPFSKSIEDVEKILKEKISWILKKQKQIIETEKSVEIIKPDFSEKTTLPYLGRNYEIEIKVSDLVEKTTKEKEGLVLKNGQFLFTIHRSSTSSGNNENNNEKIKKMYEDWLKNQAETIFKTKVEFFEKIVNVHPKKIVVKRLKNRWGSISKNDMLNLNVNLVKAPLEVIDYIIIHELCHLIIKGHSYRFWSLLKKFVIDYQDKINWLAKNGLYLLD